MSVTAEQHYTFDGVNYRRGQEIPEDVAAEHGLVEASGSAGPGLDEVDFGSSAGEELAVDAGLGAEDFSGTEPSGKTGYTKADVEALIEASE